MRKILSNVENGLGVEIVVTYAFLQIHVWDASRLGRFVFHGLNGNPDYFTLKKGD